MKVRFKIWSLLLLLFFASATDKAWACGHDAATSPTESSKTSCCDHKEAASAAASTQGEQCPCDHDHGGCHCPGCGGTVSCSGSSALFIGDEAPSLSPFLTCDAGSSRQAFYFAEHLPEAVYLPIWQPPKIGA